MDAESRVLQDAIRQASQLQQLLLQELPHHTHLHTPMMAMTQLLQDTANACDCQQSLPQSDRQAPSYHRPRPSHAPPPFPGPTNPLHILFHIHNSAPNAALLTTSLLPPKTLKALHTSCRAGRDIVQQICTTLTFNPYNHECPVLPSLLVSLEPEWARRPAPLPVKEIVPRFPHVSCVVLEVPQRRKPVCPTHDHLHQAITASGVASEAVSSGAAPRAASGAAPGAASGAAPGAASDAASVGASGATTYSDVSDSIVCFAATCPSFLAHIHTLKLDSGTFLKAIFTVYRVQPGYWSSAMPSHPPAISSSKSNPPPACTTSHQSSSNTPMSCQQAATPLPPPSQAISSHPPPSTSTRPPSPASPAAVVSPHPPSALPSPLPRQTMAAPQPPAYSTPLCHFLSACHSLKTLIIFTHLSDPRVADEPGSHQLSLATIHLPSSAEERGRFLLQLLALVQSPKPACLDNPHAVHTSPMNHAHTQPVVSSSSLAPSHPQHPFPPVIPPNTILPPIQDLLLRPPFLSTLSSFGMENVRLTGLAASILLRGAPKMRDLQLNDFTDSAIPSFITVLRSAPLPQLRSLRLFSRWDDCLAEHSYDPAAARSLYEDLITAIASRTQLRNLQFLANSFPLRLSCLSLLTQLQISMSTIRPLHPVQCKDFSGISGLASLEDLRIWDVEAGAIPRIHSILASLQSLPKFRCLRLCCAGSMPGFDYAGPARELWNSPAGDALKTSGIALPALEVIQARSYSEWGQDELASYLDVGSQVFITGIITAIAAPALVALDMCLSSSSMLELATTPLGTKLHVLTGLKFALEGGDDLIALAAKCPSLLGHPGLLPFEVEHKSVIKAAVIAGTSLQKLDLSAHSIPKLGDDTLVAIGSACPCLTSLGLWSTLDSENSKGFSKWGVALLSRMLPNMQHLHLEGCCGIDDTSFRELVSGCTQLRHLQLDTLQGVSEEAVLELTRVSSSLPRGCGKMFVMVWDTVAPTLSLEGQQLLQWFDWAVEMRQREKKTAGSWAGERYAWL